MPKKKHKVCAGEKVKKKTVILNSFFASACTLPIDRIIIPTFQPKVGGYMCKEKKKKKKKKERKKVEKVLDPLT